MAQTKTISTKIKKKKWYPLVAPKIFRNVTLGETLVFDEKAMLGKTITQNLMSLTGDIKKQNINIDFIVTKVENGRALTKIVGFRMIPTSVKRLTRRRSQKISLSFTCNTADGKQIRIKPLIFAISTTKGSVATHLRRSATEYLIKTINKMTYENLLIDLINHKFQYSLKDSIKKIYPIRASEIREMYIEKEKRHDVETKEEIKDITIEKKEDTKEIVKENKEEVEEKPIEEKVEETVKEKTIIEEKAVEEIKEDNKKEIIVESKE